MHLPHRGLAGGGLGLHHVHVAHCMHRGVIDPLTRWGLRTYVIHYGPHGGRVCDPLGVRTTSRVCRL